LQQFEAERWRGAPTPYNPLLVHTTIPLALYENQRLDMRLKTIAVSGGRPKFSPAGLGRHGHRAPFELKLPSRNEGAEATVPAWRSGIQLPLKEAPWVLPRPTTPTQPTLDGVERSHFWLYGALIPSIHLMANQLSGLTGYSTLRILRLTLKKVGSTHSLSMIQTINGWQKCLLNLKEL